MEQRSSEQRFALSVARSILFDAWKRTGAGPEAGNNGDTLSNRSLLLTAYVSQRAMGFCEACGAFAPCLNETSGLSGEVYEINQVQTKEAPGGLLTLMYLCRDCMERAEDLPGLEFAGLLLKKLTWLEKSIGAGSMMYVTAAVIADGSKVLITKRADRGPTSGKWEFPGGKVMPGETLEECIVREIKEELNLTLAQAVPFRLIDQDYGDFQIRLFNHMGRVKDTSALRLHVHTDYAWVPINDLRQFDFSGADRKLADFLSRQKNI